MDNFLFIRPDIIQKNMLGDEQMIKTFIGMYLEHCRADFDQLKRAVESRNRVEMAAKAHHIKPTMAYIGALDLRDQFQSLETAARGTVSINIIVENFQHLAKQFEVMMQELDTFYARFS